ncbi:conserved repeat domain protein [Deinococcus proteolyticus MRP]|uniref:Conserved repeat domain protein n=1 Tax=Deinococcus proteolyticus (strain ATCC 35074 / DSM 20540 / JCM 6276 / NBRC 101906 / NCIMB 13154 / VKM Ac-1939 / CCM 2703 / MRP) TaxID=693977 RepID=F0RIY7_DEIPM|nr:DUF11 domain-containing protein [Deinococcus proteolyticus]ADY25395.1 conserved repeat domain protein [Deinococcus proteolyticus MRP]
MTAVSLLGHAGAQTATSVLCDASDTSGSSNQPNHQSICWIDFSSLSTSTVRTSAGQAFVVNLPDGSRLRFTVSSPTSSAQWAAVAAPSWSGAAIGSTAGSYSGITGKPVVRYTSNTATPGTLNITNISMTDALGAPVSNFYLVAADGESTNADNASSYETWQATINSSAGGSATWEQFDRVPNTAGTDPSNSTPGGSGVGPTQAGVGTRTVTHTGVSLTNAGSYIYRTKAPTSITLNTTSPSAGMQGILLAVQVAVVNTNKVIQPSRAKAADQFTYSVTGANASYTVNRTTSGTVNSGFAPATLDQLSGLNAVTVSETMTAGSASALSSYNSTYSCTNVNPVATTTLPSGSGTTFSFSPQPGDVITCTFTNAPKVAPTPQLSLSKTDNGAIFTAGSTGSYDLKVTNTSDVAATSGALTLSDLLPSGLSYADVTANVAGTLSSKPAAGATGQVNWTFTPSNPLGPGQSVTFAVRVNVSNTLGNGSTLTNYASVGGGGDPDAQPTPGATCTGEQCASDTTTVNRVTQLTLRKEFPQGANSTANRFTIRIRNGTATLGSATTASGTTPPAVSTNMVEVTPGTTYTLDEVAADSGSYLSTYVSRYTCTNETAGSTTVMPTNVTGTTFNLTPQAGDVITCTFSNYKTAPQPPLECKSTMYGLVGDNTNGFYRVQTINPTSGAAGGTTIWTTPADSATLAVSPDGSRLFSAAYDSATLHYRDVTLGTSGSVAIPGYSSANGVLLRMAIAPDGTGYLTSGTQYWTFTSSGTPAVSGPYPLTSSDGTVDTSGNGDLIVGSNGSVYIMKSPSPASNYIDVFKISGTSGTTAQYYGRITNSNLNQAFGGAAALASGVYVSSTSGRLATVNLAMYSATTVTGSAAVTADLASCYYPDLAPNITATKSVRKVAGSAGNVVQPGDTLEYTIVTRNAGTLSASTTTLQDTVPAGTTYVAGSTALNFVGVGDRTGVTGNDVMPFSVARAINSPGASSGVVEVDGSEGSTTTSSTDPDDNEVVVTFRVTVNSGVSEIRNRATVVHVDGTAQTNETVTSSGQPALAVVKSVDKSYITVTPDPSNTGTATLPAAQLSPAQLKYTITVTNNGTAAATGVTVTDTLPAQLTYASATLAKSSAANTYGAPVALTNTGSGQNLAFSVGDLPITEPGRSVQIVVTTNVKLQANTNQTALLNTASATASGLTPVSSGQVRTDVVYPKLTKRVRNVTQNKPVNPDGTAAYSSVSVDGFPGNVLEYCLDYRNHSSVSINNWTLTDSIPGNTTFVPDSQSPAAATFTAGPGKGQIQYGPVTLTPGQSGSVCFRVKVD